MTNSLAKLEGASKALSEARTLPDILEIKDIAQAAAEYARAAKLGLEAQNYAAEINLRAQRRAGSLLAELKRGSGGDQITKRGNLVRENSQYKTALDDSSTSYQEAGRYQKVASIPDERFEEILEEIKDGGELSTNRVMRVNMEKERVIMREERKDAPPLPANKYRVIYADPPWSYSNSGFDQSAAAHYPTMTNREIEGLPISNLAHDDSVLYMWAVSPLLDVAFDVIKAWGFEYKTSIVWVKNKAPGMGWWLNTYHEFLLIASRGSHTIPQSRLDSVVYADVGKHSEKPRVFRDRIEAVHNAPFIELFARKSHEGWDSWGNE